jgi:chromosomal replication initiation ATPase DnaA
MADFLIAPCNRDAVAWVDRWPEWSAPALILYGSSGSGKSHLAHVWRARSNAVLVQGGAFPSLLSGQVNVLGNIVLDGLQMPFDEEALLHIYNLVAEQKGSLLISSADPPGRWGVALKDLSSRLLACPAIGIGPPDDALIGAVMVKQFTDRQVKIDPEVLTFLLARMERSFAAVSQLVAALDQAALAEKRRITVPLARGVGRVAAKIAIG